MITQRALALMLLEHVPFARAHFTRSSLLFFDRLYPLKRFRLNG